MAWYRIVYGLVEVRGETSAYYFCRDHSARGGESLVCLGGAKVPGVADEAFLVSKMRQLCPDAVFSIEEVDGDFKKLVNFSTVRLYRILVDPSDIDKISSLRQRNRGLPIALLILRVLKRAGIAVPP